MLQRQPSGIPEAEEDQEDDDFNFDDNNKSIEEKLNRETITLESSQKKKRIQTVKELPKLIDMSFP